MIKFVLISCVVLAVIGAVVAIPGDEKAAAFRCPYAPKNGQHGWNIPSGCADSCAGRGLKACCCKPCGFDNNNLSCECQCCQSNVECGDYLTAPNMGCEPS